MSTQRIAVVTGTSSGIGLHTAVGLAGAGLLVVATMRDPDRAGPLRAAARSAGVDVDVRPLDVTDADAAGDCLRQVLADHGTVDVLVNNAGRGSLGTLEQLSLADLRAQLEVNYLGVAALTRSVLPSMRQQGLGRGRIRSRPGRSVRAAADGVPAPHGGGVRRRPNSGRGRRGRGRGGHHGHAAVPVADVGHSCGVRRAVARRSGR